MSLADQRQTEEFRNARDWEAIREGIQRGEEAALELERQMRAEFEAEQAEVRCVPSTSHGATSVCVGLCRSGAGDVSTKPPMPLRLLLSMLRLTLRTVIHSG